MSDFEYEDDLDILTSLMDDEDDEEEAKKRKSKASNFSSLNNRPYEKKPQSNAKKTRYLTASRKEDCSASTSENTSAVESSGRQEGWSKEDDEDDFDDEEDIDDLTALLEVEKTDENRPTPGQDFDDEEDIDDLTALLEVEKTDENRPTPDQAEMNQQPSTSSGKQTTSKASTSQQKSKSPSSAGPRSTQIKSEEDGGDDERRASPERSDQEKTKDELLEELQRMKAAMAEMKANQSPPQNQTAAKKSATKSPQREMFSEAIAPKLETTKKTKPSNKYSKGESSQSSGKVSGSQASKARDRGSQASKSGDRGSQASKSGDSSPDDGSQREKKKYTMDADAATRLFHSSQSDDDDDQNLDSSSDEEDDKLLHELSQSSTPTASKPADMFTKNKRRVAHTPNNQPIKPKKESPYQCKLCGKAFNDFHVFETHKFTHRKNPGNMCSLCQKTFSSRSQLETHLRNHGEKGQKELLRLNRSSSASKPRTQVPTSGYKSSTGSSSSSQGGASVSRYRGDERQKGVKEEEGCETEYFSQIRIINPIMSRAGMKEKMSGRKFIRLSIIKKYITTGGDVEGDWATMGVVVSKVPPKTSSKGKVFSIWKVSDLTGPDSTVALFLFGKVHEHHWKAVEGSVVGILNANIMPNREPGQSGEISMTVDHPQKMLIMGKSKDFGFCKAKKKNGNPCTMVVNKATCEYCEFHVQSEYKKVSSKRSELQSTFSGSEPKKFTSQRFNGAMKGMYNYGGQSFHLDNKVKVKATAQKKGQNAVCKSLGTGKEVERMMEEARKDVKKDVVLMHGKGKDENDTLVSISGASHQFKDLLSKPTPGTQNLMRHMVTAETKEKPNIKSITASELIKQQKQEMKAKQQAAQSKQQATQSKAPKLGRGMEDDEDFIFHTELPEPQPASESKSKSSMNAALARKKALELVRKIGPLTKKDPNCIGRNKGSSEKKQEAVRRRADRDWHERNGAETSPENNEEPAKKKKRRSFLGADDSMSNEEMKSIISAKSKNAGLFAEIEAERQDKYFSELEKKERLELKMATVMEKKCQVVSCKKCEYTWFAPSKLCRDENHHLVRHEATERFYTCNKCKTRTITFSKIPTTSCRSCGSTSFERASMLKERKGPMLESEKLLLRGEERKYVSS